MFKVGDKVYFRNYLNNYKITKGVITHITYKHPIIPVSTVVYDGAEYEVEFDNGLTIYLNERALFKSKKDLEKRKENVKAINTQIE